MKNPVWKLVLIFAFLTAASAASILAENRELRAFDKDAGYMVFTFTNAEGDVFRGLGPKIYLHIEILADDQTILGFDRVEARSFVDRYQRHQYYLCRVPSGKRRFQLRVSIAEITVKNKGETKLVRYEDGYAYTIIETTADGRVFRHRTLYVGPHVSQTEANVFVVPGEVRMSSIDLSKYFKMKRRQEKVIELAERLPWEIEKNSKFQNLDRFQSWVRQKGLDVVQIFEK